MTPETSPLILDELCSCDSVVHGEKQESGAISLPFTPAQAEDALFLLWINGVRRENKTYKKIKVPNRILALPCGCRREPGNEVDINEFWHFSAKGGDYYHTFCGKKIGPVNI